MPHLVLDCFYLANKNNPTINIWVHDFVFISLWYIPRSRIAGPYGSSMSNLARNCQFVIVVIFFQK